MKKIVIAGASGLIGSKLSLLLAKSGYKVLGLVRGAAKISQKIKHDNIEFKEWSSENEPKLVAQYLEGAHAVINLAGSSVGGKRWNKEVKEELYNSRIHSTRQLVTASDLCNEKPEVYISASGVGIYGYRGDEVLNEDSSKGNDFLAKLCIDWELEAHKADKFARVVCIRTAVVFDKHAGGLQEIIKPFKFFVGGWFGDGRQWFPWIHIDDIINIYKFCIENEKVVGALNASAPDVVRNKEFSKEVAAALHRPCLFPVPGFALRLAVGEFADTLLNGQRTSSEKLQTLGYGFKYPELKPALSNLLQ